ncbi:MAG: DUF4097 domain-containing protein [Eubacteriaceae bacterium]|nr:DUF4097 domain-containing protein [Eubacteriaceae bacterium]
MKNRNLVVGIILILVGGFWFLDNLNLINFSVRYIFDALWQLWPLIIVFVGINIMISNKKLEGILWIIFLLIILGYAVLLQFGGPVFNNNNDNNDNGDNGGSYSENIYDYPMTSDIKSGSVKLDVGGTKFSLTSDGSNNLTSIDSNLEGLSYNIMDNSGGSSSVEIKNDGDLINIGDSSDNYLDTYINNSIPWKIEVNCGAVSGDVDLKDVIAEKVNVSVGAGKLDITLGSKAKKLDFDLSSGVSEVTVYLPKDAGLKIDFQGALNSSNISELGLIKNENTYTSTNYDTAAVKIALKAEMGLGKLDFHYY